MTIVRGVVVPEMVSRQAYGAINGALAVPMVLAKAGAPLAAAWLWTISGGYSAVLICPNRISLLMVGAFSLTASRSRRKAGDR